MRHDLMRGIVTMRRWIIRRARTYPCLAGLCIVLILAMVPASAQTAGVSLRIASETVPAGGMLQLKAELTEPKPILKGRQSASFSNSSLEAPVDAHLFSPAGDASGVAVFEQGEVQVFFSSPVSSFGTALNQPVFTISLPLNKDASVGQHAALTLDGDDAEWFDPSSAPYMVKLKPGVLTVGGTFSISSVSPGSGVVPAGSVISIEGVGFPPSSRVKIENAIVLSQRYASPNLLQVTLAADTDMEGRRVRVVNKRTNETATFYSYQRTVALGSSTQPLVAASFPLFSRSLWTVSYFRPVISAGVFSALALQNPTTSNVLVRLDLYSPSRALLASQFVSLTGNSHITRDLREFFPATTVATGTQVKISSGAPIHVLGFIGDDASSTVLPVEPSAAP